MIVKNYILEQIKANYDDCIIQPIIVNINKPIVSQNTENDIYVLNSKLLDIPVTAQLHINSDDNSLVTSKVEYDNFKGYKSQVFSGNISIELKNYGTYFTPYQLEFVKITPLIKKCQSKQNNCEK